MALRDAAGQGLLSLVLGGARSGKSRYAERLITTYPPPWIYVATAEAGDGALAGAPAKAAILVDCLTLWLSNVLQSGLDIDAGTTSLLEVLAARAGPTVIVSNEVGLGIVPENALARRFRDLQGTLNQRLAAQAQRVIMMVAGVPVAVKGP